MPSISPRAAVLAAVLSAALLGKADAATCSSVSTQCGDGYTYKTGAAAAACVDGSGAAVTCEVGTSGSTHQDTCCDDASSTCAGTGITGGAGTCTCDAGYHGTPVFTTTPSPATWSNPCELCTSQASVNDGCTADDTSKCSTAASSTSLQFCATAATGYHIPTDGLAVACAAQTGCTAGKSTPNVCSTTTGIETKLPCTAVDNNYVLEGDKVIDNSCGAGTDAVPGVKDCVCDHGYSGTPTWTASTADTTATVAAAPGSSTSNDVGQNDVTIDATHTGFKAGQTVTGPSWLGTDNTVASDVAAGGTTLTLTKAIASGATASDTLTFSAYGTWDNSITDITVATGAAAIPAGQTSVTLASATTLTFGQTVTGDGIASGTTIANVGVTTTNALTLSVNVESGGIAGGTTLTIHRACTAVACPEGSTGTVPGTSGMNGKSGCERVAGWSGKVVRTATDPWYESTMAEVACPAGSTGTVPGDTGTDGTSGCTAMVGYLGSVTRTTYDPFFVKTLYMTDAEAIICGGQVGCDGEGCSCVEVQGMFAVVVIPLIPVVLLMLMFMFQTFCTGMFSFGSGDDDDGNANDGVELANRSGPARRPAARPPARNPAPARSPRGAAEEASDGSSPSGSEAEPVAARAEAVDKFVAMGFSETAAKVALRKAGGNEQRALNSLLTGV